MNAERFEDLRVSQQARQQAGEVYGLMTHCPKASRDFGFRDQIQRAAVSVMNNVAEGFEYRSDADFARFLGHAKGSCAEVRSMFYLAEDLGYCREADLSAHRDRSEVLSKGLATLQNYLRQ